MAESNDTAAPVEETIPVEAPVAETEVVETPVVEKPVVEIPTPAPVVPAPIVHDPFLLSEARALGITAEFAATMSPNELSRHVVLGTKARVAQGRPTQAQEAPAPEPDFALPAELKAKLAEFDPAITQAVELAARAGVDRAKKAEEQLAQVRQEQVQATWNQQVQSVMASVPGLGAGQVREGSKEAAKRQAIIHYLGTLQASGQHPGPPEVAIPMANAILFGGDATPAPAPAKPGKPTATPTARPTNRLGAREDDNSEDAIAARWDAWKRDQEKQLNGSTNGEFVP